jgi:ribosomal protein S18 acetylase RimI-like enzyme
MYCQPDVWLEPFLQKPTFRVTESGMALPAVLSQYPQCFISAKIPVQQVDTLHAFFKKQFWVVDTLVDFEQTSLPSESVSSVNCRWATAQDEPAVSKIAETAFQYSRFHQDPAISSVTANTIKREWTLNFFKKQRGDYMVVSRINDFIVGYLLLLQESNKVRIDLIAVDPTVKRQGVARAMCAFVNQELGPMTAGTQLANQASIGLYGSLGFVQQRAHYVLHYHHNTPTLTGAKTCAG